MAGLHHLFALLCLASVTPGRLTLDKYPCFYNQTKSIDDLSECLMRVKSAAASTRRFWFGEQWDSECVGSHKEQTIGCYNPESLRKYRSIGSRLLRVPTFDMAFLRNLRIFPQLTFESEPGSYKGCDHIYQNDQGRIINAQPDMNAASPWNLRKLPKIHWSNMNTRHWYTIVIMDVGFGYLQHLLHNFPSNTSIVKSYSGPLNFRHQLNPYAVIIFEQPNGQMPSLNWKNAMLSDKTFDLQRFILSNGFQQSLIGLNWVVVGTDAYAIEQQRRNNVVDNCPLLIKQKMFSPLSDLRFSFLPPPSLDHVDAWMTVNYYSTDAQFSVCCEYRHYRPTKVKLDPLGDKLLLPIRTHHSPAISVPHLQTSLYTAYHRKSRDYVALLDDDLYTLVMVDSGYIDSHEEHKKPPLVHWLVVDIPGSALVNGYIDGLAGKVILNYLPPLPTDRRQQRYVFLLFTQNDGPINFDHRHFSPDNCPSKWRKRCRFDIHLLMARHSLRLKSISWMQSETDHFVRYSLVHKMHQSESSVCRRYGLKHDVQCKTNAQFSKSPHSASSKPTFGFLIISCSAFIILLLQYKLL